MLFSKLKIGGLIVADNVLWSGKVTKDVVTRNSINKKL